jgi:MFS family permease
MSRVGSYMHCILAGFVLWTLGSGLTLLFNQKTGLGPLIAILIVQGAGIGMTLQPTLVGMYANSRSEDRAVTTGLRNFIRTIGGAFGLVIAGVILSNTLRNQLSAHGTTDETIAQLTSSTYGLDEMDMSEKMKERVLAAYMDGLYYIFIFFTACSGSSVLLTALVGDTSLKPPPKTTTSEKPSSASSSPEETTAETNSRD